MAASCARHLRAAGVAAGDRVVIVSENRPEYPIAETALMALRAVPVPTYTTNTVADHAHILRDSRRPGGDRVLPCPRRRAARGRPAGGRPRSAGGDRWAAGRRGGTPRLMHWAELVGRHARRPTTSRWRPRPSRRRARLPDLHLRHRRRAQGRDAAAPLDPVELPRCVRAAAAAASCRTRCICLTCRSRTATSTRSAVLPAQHRHRDRLLPRRRASGRRHADGAPDHPDRGAARAGGDPQPRADAGGAAAGLAAGAVPPGAGRSA